jgi:predicted ribosome quality control (RQC) complex YloA/Tae2 family protein
MNEATIQAVTDEVGSLLPGRYFGKIFQLTKLQIAVDFRLPEGYLFVSVEPANPRFYLIKRRLKDLEKQSDNPSQFILLLRKRLSNATVISIEKVEGERIVRMRLEATDELEGAKQYTLVLQLTGRSANVFLLDSNDFVIERLRDTHGEGQENATRYSAPVRPQNAEFEGPDLRSDSESEISNLKFQIAELKLDRSSQKHTAGPGKPSTSLPSSLSELLDNYYKAAEEEKAFQGRARSARTKLMQEISRNEKLLKNLQSDLKNHGKADDWKRKGDILLANLSTATRAGDKITVVDYFDENAPAIEIAVDENKSLTEAAEEFFRRYTKARNAKVEIEKRVTAVDAEILELRSRLAQLDEAIAAKSGRSLDEFDGGPKIEAAAKVKPGREPEFRGARRFTSSDGFEILVGKAAKDNDYLTFRVAKSSDLWLHAGDYTGSHVVVKNPGRVEIPQRTLFEAAQLAAFYSRAREHPKAAVHYTQRKFVHKPKGSVLGLVSLSSYKTILVEPKVGNLSAETG